MFWLQCSNITKGGRGPAPGANLGRAQKSSPTLKESMPWQQEQSQHCFCSSSQCRHHAAVPPLTERARVGRACGSSSNSSNWRLGKTRTLHAFPPPPFSELPPLLQALLRVQTLLVMLLLQYKCLCRVPHGNNYTNFHFDKSKE